MKFLALLLSGVLATELDLISEHDSSEHSDLAENVLLETTTISGDSSLLLPGRYATSTFRRNRRLSAVPVLKNITGLNGLSSYHCLSECVRMGNECGSFNFARKEGVCELLTGHICSRGGLRFEKSDIFSYYDVYEKPGSEENGPMHGSAYCQVIGFCNPLCEPYARMPALDEACSEDFECNLKNGDDSICRLPPGLCKCKDDYYISKSDQNNKTKSCAKLDVEGYKLFPNLKSDEKQGLYFKLVFLDMTFQMAANHCSEVEGGFLAEAEDGEINRFLRAYMRKNKVRSAYLGLSDLAQEGNWVWMNSGQKLKSSQFWKSGAPDNFQDSEHCATITNEIDFGWDDVPCEKLNKFFCQRIETN